MSKKKGKPGNRQAFLRTVYYTLDSAYRIDSIIDQFDHFSHTLSSTMDRHLLLFKVMTHPGSLKTSKTRSLRVNVPSYLATTLSTTFMKTESQNFASRLVRNTIITAFSILTPKTRKMVENGEAVAGLSKSEPPSNIYHEREFKKDLSSLS